MVLISWRLSRSSKSKREQPFEDLTRKKSKSCAATTARSGLSRRTGSDRSILLDWLERAFGFTDWMSLRAKASAELSENLLMYIKSRWTAQANHWYIDDHHDTLSAPSFQIFPKTQFCVKFRQSYAQALQLDKDQTARMLVSQRDRETSFSILTPVTGPVQSICF
jgi:hypothetical protein